MTYHRVTRAQTTFPVYERSWHLALCARDAASHQSRSMRRECTRTPLKYHMRYLYLVRELESALRNDLRPGVPRALWAYLFATNTRSLRSTIKKPIRELTLFRRRECCNQWLGCVDDPICAIHPTTKKWDMHVYQIQYNSRFLWEAGSRQRLRTMRWSSGRIQRARKFASRIYLRTISTDT